MCVLSKAAVPSPTANRFSVFATLGYLAVKRHQHFEEVAQDGLGLAFMVFPQATATMPLSQVSRL